MITITASSSPLFAPRGLRSWMAWPVPPERVGFVCR